MEEVSMAWFLSPVVLARRLSVLLLLLTFTFDANALIADVNDVRQIARLYSAAFDRAPKVDGLNFWVDSFEEGRSVTDMARDFYNSPEFTSKYGPLNERQYVEQLYRNVLGRGGAQSGINFWVGHLQKGTSRSKVLSSFAGSPENIMKTDQLFANMQLVDGLWVFEPQDAGSKLPQFAGNSIPRLRGAQLMALDWANKSLGNWNVIEDFPEWGGNALRIFISPYEDGVALLPGQPLSSRLAASLKRYIDLINWANERNVYVIVNFNPYYAWPPPAANWPDDGRSLWSSDSAQNELIDAWKDLAKRYKGRPGIIFDLINEPHGLSHEEMDNFDEMTKRAWNSLYPRLVDAIQTVDPGRWVMVSPIWGAPQNLSDLVVVQKPRVMYTFHFYSPHFFTMQGQAGSPPAGTVEYPGVTREHMYEGEQFWDRSTLQEKLQSAIDFRDANSVRLVCGEYGSNSFAPEESRARWLQDLLGILELYELDHIYFQYETNPGLPSSGNWTFEGTSFESIVTDKFSLNFSD